MSSRNSKPGNTSISVNSVTKQSGNHVTGVTVKANGNPVEVWADYALWDTVANKFVAPEDTTFKDPK